MKQKSNEEFALIILQQFEKEKGLLTKASDLAGINRKQITVKGLCSMKGMTVLKLFCRMNQISKKGCLNLIDDFGEVLDGNKKIY